MQYVEAKSYTLSGKAAAAPGEELVLTLRVGDKVLKPAPPGNFAESLTLRDGENELELVAVNKGAPAGREKLETEVVPLRIVVNRPSAPRIALTHVEPFDRPGERIPLEQGKELTLASHRVRVFGTIKAPKGLLEIARLNGKALTGFKANAQGEFDISEDVTFDPAEPAGKGAFQATALRFEAKTANSDPGEATARFAFLPPLPKLEIADPRAGAGPVSRRTGPAPSREVQRRAGAAGRFAARRRRFRRDRARRQRGQGRSAERSGRLRRSVVERNDVLRLSNAAL